MNNSEMSTPDVPYWKATGFLTRNKLRTELLASSKSFCFNETCWNPKPSLLANEDISLNSWVHMFGLNAHKSPNIVNSALVVSGHCYAWHIWVLFLHTVKCHNFFFSFFPLSILVESCIVFQGPVSETSKKPETELNWNEWRLDSGLGLFRVRDRAVSVFLIFLNLRKPPKNQLRPVKTETGLSTGFNIKHIYNRHILINVSFIFSP